MWFSKLIVKFTLLYYGYSHDEVLPLGVYLQPTLPPRSAYVSAHHSLLTYMVLFERQMMILNALSVCCTLAKLLREEEL